MTITEIALLRLVPPMTVEDESLCSKLTIAKDAMKCFTGHNYRYLQELEETSLIYVIGEWESLDQYYKQWIPSPSNQKLLDSLTGLLAVEWLIDLDVPPATLPIPTGLRQGPAVVSITRHFIKDGQNERFKNIFKANKHYAENFTAEGKPFGGWRVDKEPGKKEFVLFLPWKDVDQHRGFARAVGSSEYPKIKDACTDTTAKLLEWLL